MLFPGIPTEMLRMELKEHYTIPTPAIEKMNKNADLPKAAMAAAASTNLDEDLPYEWTPIAVNYNEDYSNYEEPPSNEEDCENVYASQP